MNGREMNHQRLRVAVAVSIVALVAAMCGFAIFTHPTPTYATGRAADNAVAELLSNHYEMRTDGKIFDRKQINALLEKLGGANATLATVSALGTQDAGHIRTRNGGDVTVTFGGMEWNVTHLTQDNNGNTIVTFWLASSSEVIQYNPWTANAPTLAYPCNMYSTSLIRAQALNSGGCGYVATQGASTLTPIAQDAEHTYAKFTMTGIQGSLTKYIVAPINVAYQETETIRSYYTSWNTCPNEAWGTPASASYSSNMNYSGKSYYTQWASDYIWLPSLAETGASDITGIWNLSESQRSNSVNTWLRTGYYPNSLNSCSLYENGTSSDLRTTYELAVRPAMHFNLTEAVADAIDPMTVPTTDTSKTYAGGAQTFALQNYDENKIDVTVSGKDPAGQEIAASDIAFDRATGEISAKYAGTYTVVLSLKTTDTFWKSGDDNNGNRTLTFAITPKQLTLALSNDVPDGKWEWTLGGAYKAMLTASGIEAGDTVGLHAAYTEDTSGAKQEVAATQDGAQTVATIDLSQIAIGTYKLTAVLDNSVGESINYSIRNGLNTAGIPRAFTVLSKKIDTSNIAWQYTVLGPSGNPLPNATDLEIANGRQIVFAYFGTLDSYGAVTNKLEINRSTLPTDNQDNLLVEIDNLTSSFNGTTYTDGYSNPSGSAVAHYTTKVLLKIVHDDYLFDNNKKQIELTIDWEIVKGTFDLSGVKWKYKYTTDTGTVSNVYDPDTTKLEYNDGKIIRVEIDPTTLPLGLSAPGGIFDYQNASGIEVKTYAATVAGDTLEYDDACFEQPADLVLNWEILGKGIAVKWKPVQNGTYYLKELNCDPKYTIGDDKIVHYKYFAPDGSLLGIDEAGRQALADKVIADNIGPENPQTFTIEAYLDGNNSGNYRLLTDPARTTVSIGNDPFTAVEAQVPETATYDGNAHYTQDDIQFMGAPIRPTDYTVTYYAGTDVSDLSNNTKLDGAPTDAGKYVIAIEMTDESYLLNRGVFAVKILPKQIAVPTVKEAMFNGTEYSLLDLLTGYDAALMTLDLVTTATNAGTYHATVTLPNSNYVWATADGATGSQEYALEWSISKVKLTEIWGTDSNGKPTLSVSSKYADYVQIVYEYYDANGNLVAEADLVAGQSYKVVAKLSASSAANFELADVNGDVSDTPSESAPKQFVYGNDPNNPSGSGNNDGNATVNGMSEPWFKIVMIAIAIGQGGSFIVLIAIWMAVMSIRRARKKKA